jgi:Amt family ammonium transporter
VEDNEVNQMVAGEVLRNAGFSVEVASDGRAALDAIFGKSFDLVLMDCQMPEMDGFDATRAVRARELQHGGILPGRATRIPIIALTANALKGDCERCLAAGMDGYITKPIDGANDARDDPLASPGIDADADDGETAPAATTTAKPSTSERDGSAARPSHRAEPLDIDALLKRCLGKATSRRRSWRSSRISRSNISRR